MISLAAIRTALNAVTPHLPKSASVLFTRSLPYLPLAFELSIVLYQHREKLGQSIGNLATQSSKGIIKGASKVVDKIPYMSKKAKRKLQRRLRFLPVAIKIAKVSYRKKGRKYRKLTKKFPNKVKRKINKTLEKHKLDKQSNLFTKLTKTRTFLSKSL